MLNLIYFDYSTKYLCEYMGVLQCVRALECVHVLC